MDVIKLIPDPGAPYQKMYTILFNTITDAVGLLDENEVMKAQTILMQAQQDTEELYISANE